MTVPKPKTGAKPPDRIYEIDCPVTVETQRGPNRKGQEPGRLRQIGIRGAQCCFAGPLTANESVTLHVCFSHPGGKFTEVLFPAVVTDCRSEPPYEAELRFQGKAKFLRNRIEDLLRDSSTS
jgi:hypothetical protein